MYNNNPPSISTLDSRLRSTVRGNVLEHPAPGVSLDSGPMEGMLCLEPLEQSILHSSWIARPRICVRKERSEWKPVINPVISYTLDGRPMEGNTYPEHLALGVCLDSGLTEGASCLEQSVLSSSLAARPVECVAENVSDWKPVINPVQDITPDGRPMEETAYPSIRLRGASLDSGLRAGMSSLKPLQQSVLKTSLVARPQVEIRTSDWKPVINPVQDITTPDGRPMEGTTYPEHPALGVSLDSGLMEGTTRSVTRPDGGSIRKFAKRNVMAHPVPDINLDGRPMEGNTYLEPSALGVSLDSGLMQGLLCPEPLEQSVLGALSAIRPDGTDKPERPALASQMHHKQSCFQSSARPMMNPNIINHTYVNEDIDTDLPESTAPMMNSQTNHEQPCFNSSARPMLDPETVNQTDVNSNTDTDLPENSAPMMNSDLIFVDWEDAIRREVLRNRLMGYRSSREINDQLLSPEHANMSDAGIVLDQVHSEGLRQWNMFMDGKYDYETVNGLPGYYGGDLYDLYDTEDTDELDPDVQEGIDFITYTHSRPDCRKARGVNRINIIYICRTMSKDKPGALDEPDRLSEMDASHIEEVDIIGLCQCPEFGEGEDPSVPSDELHANIGLYMPNQKGVNCVIGACVANPRRKGKQ